MSEAINRKEFLDGLVRKDAILGLGGVAVAATRGSKSPEECFDTALMCNECWAFKGCALPEKGLEPDERAKKNRPA